MGADRAVLDLCVVEQADQERTRYMQCIGSLLGGQLGLRGKNGHALAVREAVEYLRQCGQCLAGHLHVTDLPSQMQSHRTFSA